MYAMPNSAVITVISMKINISVENPNIESITIITSVFSPFTLESISSIRIETVEAYKNSRSPLSYLNIRKACLLIL